MIDCVDIGVGAEKIKNNLGESDNKYRNFRICLSEGGNEGGEHDGVPVTFSCKNDDALELAIKERGWLSALNHNLCVR